MTDPLPSIASAVWAMRRIHHTHTSLNGGYAEPPVAGNQILVASGISAPDPNDDTPKETS